MTPKPHIILADDEDLVAMTIALMLEDYGFRVTVTRNGQEALHADGEDPASLLLTDMRMPVMDGTVLVKLMRQRHPRLPIVVMTGYSEAIPDEEAGRLSVLRKPFPLDVLHQRIRALLPEGV
ncbi:hypothetical protein [Azospirillum doebereinerae]